MEACLVIGLLLVAVVIFSTEKVSVDIVTLSMLCVLVLAGILKVDEAFAGFSNDVIVMLASIFVIGAAMRETGVLDAMGTLVSRGLSGRPARLTTVMMAGVGGVSAFMNNTTVTAMFLGPVMGLARSIKISPSRLLMPLSFASILGGTCTLIGTSTNVAVSGYLKKNGLGEIGMFEMTPIGLVILASGILYMVVIGMKMLPDRDTGEQGDTISPREYLAEVVILENSPLIGQEIYSSDFSVLEFQVLKIVRHGTGLAATPHEKLAQGDLVLVAGKVENLMKIKKIEGIDILEDLNLRSSGIDMKEAHVAEVVLTPRSGLIGRTLKEANFRQRSGLSVLAIMRGDRSMADHLGDIRLKAGDLLLLQGPYERFKSFEEQSEMVVITDHHYSTADRRKGMLVLAAFAAAVVASSFGLIPAAIAMLLAALLAVVTRCISLETAYENIDWRLLILIGGMTAFGQAMSRTGADNMLAGLITGLLQPYGPMAVLAGFCVLTVLLTQPMSNAAAALVVLPVALQAAENLHLNAHTFGIAIMLSASISVLTPFEPSCILVYGPGKYRFSDFLKVGGGLTLVMLAIVLALVPVFWPLKS
ncbi:MAG: SLC13 family permease [Verrucomicrobiaceae bacterium]|nr:SLC13 family permease [Verrucomicrobiaceae bacterium]